METEISSQLTKFLLNVEEPPMYTNKATGSYVFKAEFIHNKQQVPVAAKVYTVEVDLSGEKINEALVTKCLEDDPRVIKIYTIRQFLNPEKTAINVCIIAEYCAGMSLEKEIRRRAQLGQPWTDD